MGRVVFQMTCTKTLNCSVSLGQLLIESVCNYVDKCTLDACDHAVSVSENSVRYAYQHESVPPPNLIDPELYEIATRILKKKIGIERKHINTENCLNVFQFLVLCFS